MTIPYTSTALAGTTGTLAAPATPTTTEVIGKSNIGKILEVFNGAGAPINVTFTDPGKTPAGNAGTQPPTAVAAGARRRWKLTRQFLGDEGITVVFSSVTSVTAEIID